MIYLRLWHEELLKLLPRQQLLGLNRECCALIGLGWTKKHSTVQYALNQQIERLKAYHLRVIDEMKRRGYNVTQEWLSVQYRGKKLGIDNTINVDLTLDYYITDGNIYQEHDNEYLQLCIENLAKKGYEVL